MQLEAEDFLELLWGEDEGWVDLPAKVNGYWIPYPLEWPTTDGGTGISRRIDQSLRDGEDLYFSVARFAERGRALENVLPVSWLWADLDDVHPSAATAMGLMPTIAVESSPGRYQAYWKLASEQRPNVVEKLNRGLTYALGADKGGWDLTQVLRIPGTRNHKYHGAPRVRLMDYREGLVYKSRYVWDKVKEAVPEAELAGVTSVVLPRRDIPRKAKQLLWAKQEEVVKGEGSHKLWELNCLLAESGLTEDEIYALVAVSVWNKWKGNAARLRGDIRKAMTHVRRKAVRMGKGGEDGRKGDGTVREVDGAVEESGPVNRGRDLRSDRLAGGGHDASAGAGDEGADELGGGGDGDDGQERLPFVSYSSFMAMAMEEPKWLIEDIWTAGSHGIIGGEPKTSKTTLALAAGLAVASGTPFLGKYAVGAPGPVLMIQEENAPWMMQDRLRKLAADSGLISDRDAVVRPASAGGLGSTVLSVDLPADVPFWILNNYGFDLSEETHRDMLEGYVQEIRPVLLILDPMYLIFGPIDANSMKDLQPFLKWVIQLRYLYGTAVAIVHHMGKKSEGNSGRRAGQRLIGSATLHGFTDSALYTSLIKDDRQGWTHVSIEREFRNMEPQGALEMAWHFDEPGSLGMQMEIGDAKQRVHVEADEHVRVSRVERQIAAIVREQEGVSVSALAKRLGLDVRTIKRHINTGELMELHQQGGVKKSHQVYLNGGNHDE